MESLQWIGRSNWLACMLSCSYWLSSSPNVLRESCHTFADWAQRLQCSTDPTEQIEYLQDLREQLHKLAGSAGTFGFKDLGHQARLLEQQSQQWLSSLELQRKGAR